MRSQMVGIRQKMSAFQSTLTALKRRLLLFLIAAGLLCLFLTRQGQAAPVFAAAVRELVCLR